MIIVRLRPVGYHASMDPVHLKRIREEIKAVNAGVIARMTPESWELARLIHHDEHIGGVIYGLYPGGLAWLVATDKRVIFLDRKPLFSSHDELTYDIVVGTTSTRAGLFVTVILHTRIHDYSISFVNPNSARIFIQYVDSRRLSVGEYDPAHQRHTREAAKPAAQTPRTPKAVSPPVMNKTPIEGEALQFLKSHNLGVLSTVDRTGNVHGAAVYYHVDKGNFIYILTKTETTKGRNIYAHSQVALTIYEAESRQTLQLQGLATVETEQATKDGILAEMTNPHLYGGHIDLPPITKVHKGAFMVIRIVPTNAHFRDYGGPAD